MITRGFWEAEIEGLRNIVYINNNKEVIMDYKLHYDKLIQRAKNRKLNGYTEVHHIIPKCMNGEDYKENLVELTAREHFIAHLLLFKIYPDSYGLIKAVNMMTVESGNQDRSMNRMYGWLKERFSKEMSRSQKGKKNSQFDTVWIYNLELEVTKKIKREDFSKYENLGWLKGRIFDFDKKNKELYKKEIYNSQFDKKILDLFGYKRIPALDQIESYKNKVNCYNYMKNNIPKSNKEMREKFNVLKSTVTFLIKHFNYTLEEKRGGLRKAGQKIEKRRIL